MRVIAGSARGRQLHNFKGRQIRPTQDRVKEAVFSALMPRLPGSRVLDLFAGTGAMGIEALSRGADKAVFIEIDQIAYNLIRENLTLCGWKPSDDIRILRGDAIRWIKSMKAREEEKEREIRQFDIIFADPPYRDRNYTTTLELLSDGELLLPEGIIVMESDAKQVLPDEIGKLTLAKSRKYGTSKISYYTVKTDSDLAQ